MEQRDTSEPEQRGRRCESPHRPAPVGSSDPAQPLAAGVPDCVRETLAFYHENPPNDHPVKKKFRPISNVRVIRKLVP